MWKKQPLGRLEFPDYSLDSVFEALVNALIHRDYLVNGSEVHIDMFDDRLEIYSPGGMPDGTFIQDLDINTVSSVRRNPLLADIFGRIGYMERQGSGLGKICRAYEYQDNYVPEKEPIFTSTRSAFYVILKNLNYGVNFEEQAQSETHEPQNETHEPLPESIQRRIDLDEREKRVLQAILANAIITRAEISDITGYNLATIKRVLAELRKKEVLQRDGYSRNGKWVVKE